MKRGIDPAAKNLFIFLEAIGATFLNINDNFYSLILSEPFVLREMPTFLRVCLIHNLEKTLKIRA